MMMVMVIVMVTVITMPMEMIIKVMKMSNHDGNDYCGCVGKDYDYIITMKKYHESGHIYRRAFDAGKRSLREKRASALCSLLFALSRLLAILGDSATELRLLRYRRSVFKEVNIDRDRFR
jgi:hypothetical protein